MELLERTKCPSPLSASAPSFVASLFFYGALKIPQRTTCSSHSPPRRPSSFDVRSLVRSTASSDCRKQDKRKEAKMERERGGREEERQEGAKWDWVRRTMRSGTDIGQVTEGRGRGGDPGRRGGMAEQAGRPPKIGFPSFLPSFPSTIGYRGKLAHTANDHKYWAGEQSEGGGARFRLTNFRVRT